MTDQPVKLDQLEIIGYGGALPNGKGPAMVPPVFRDRNDASRCFVPPFRISGNWLIDPQLVSLAEVQDLAKDKRITLPAGLPQPARPDWLLWVDLAGRVHYETVADAKRNLRNLCREHLKAATDALRNGEIGTTERHAGIALAADDRALEPRALLAACHALRGAEKHVAFLLQQAESAGHSSATFGLLLKNYVELIPPARWDALDFRAVQNACAPTGVEVWASFAVTEDEFRRLLPVLHQFRRSGDEGRVLISCTGIEAELMSDRRILLAAYAHTETWVAQRDRDELLMAAAVKTLLYEPSAVAEIGHHPAFRIRRIGEVARRQLWRQVVTPVVG